jgi:hypothetical protein
MTTATHHNVRVIDVCDDALHLPLSPIFSLARELVGSVSDDPQAERSKNSHMNYAAQLDMGVRVSKSGPPRKSTLFIYI